MNFSRRKRREVSNEQQTKKKSPKDSDLSLEEWVIRTLGPKIIGKAHRKWHSITEDKENEELLTITFHEYEEAIRRVKENPDNEKAWYGITLFHVRLEAYEEAILGFLNLIRLSPRTAQYRADYGTILHLTERYEEAEEQYTEALQLNPYDDLTLRRLLYLLCGQGRNTKSNILKERYRKLKEQARTKKYG